MKGNFVIVMSRVFPSRGSSNITIVTQGISLLPRVQKRKIIWPYWQNFKEVVQHFGKYINFVFLPRISKYGARARRRLA